SLHFRALLLEMESDPALAQLPRKLLRAIFVLGRNQLRQHLDDRHLRPEPPEDRRELAADAAAAENHEPLRYPALGQQALGVDAALRIEAVDRRPERERAGRDDRGLEADGLCAFDRDRVRMREPAGALDPFAVMGLER